MTDQLDNRPVFTVVVGCAGAGKTAWKRENWDRLPNHYFDHDSFAGGVGDGDTRSAKDLGREYVDREIDRAIEARRDFGIESTCPGGPGGELVQRVKARWVQGRGSLHRDAIPADQHRARRAPGSVTHRADVAKLSEHHAVSLSDLREVLDQFDDLEIVDNSEYRGRRPRPVDQIYLEKGVVTWEADTLNGWCATWLGR